MYARYFAFKAKSGVRSEVEALADQVNVFMRSLQGFITVHFTVSEDETEYRTFSLWESRQDAESAGESLRAKTKGTLEKLAAEPPAYQLFEVYEPKS